MAEQPIGHVETADGEVLAIRADGTQVTLAEGAPVFQGDAVQTGPDGAVAIVFIDETTFSLGENARMILDELIFDPATAEGSATFSAVQGAFVFVTGKIGEKTPENVEVKTPVASIGIRGTTVGITLDVDCEAEGANCLITLIDGAITVTNAAGQVVLDTPNQTTRLTSASAPPQEPFIMTTEDLEQFFDKTLKAVPAALMAGSL